MISAKDFPYAMFTEVGDPIQITYLDTGETMSSVSKFANGNLKSKAIDILSLFSFCYTGKYDILDVYLTL